MSSNREYKTGALVSAGASSSTQALQRRAVFACAYFFRAAVRFASRATASAQENPLGEVNTPIAAPKPAAPPTDTSPGTIDPSTGKPTRRISAIRIDTNLVLVPLTVTDPMNRLVTGLERENFNIFDNNIGQTIKSFSTEDAPVTIGIVFDLSGSMSSKFGRARKALSEFMRTCNPQDEFFVVGFNDRPAVIVDYTSDIDDVEARGW